MSTKATHWSVNRVAFNKHEDDLIAELTLHGDRVSALTVGRIIARAVTTGVLTGPGVVQTTAARTWVQAHEHIQPVHLHLTTRAGRWSRYMSAPRDAYGDGDWFHADDSWAIVDAILTTAASDLTELLLANDPDAAAAYDDAVRAPQRIILSYNRLDEVLESIAAGSVPDVWPRVSRVNADPATLNAIVRAAADLGIIVLPDGVTTITFEGPRMLDDGRQIMLATPVFEDRPAMIGFAFTYGRFTPPRPATATIGAIANAPTLAAMLDEFVIWFNTHALDDHTDVPDTSTVIDFLFPSVYPTPPTAS